MPVHKTPSPQGFCRQYCATGSVSTIDEILFKIADFQKIEFNIKDILLTDSQDEELNLFGSEQEKKRSNTLTLK